jgi:hypothetical protein
MSFQKVARYIVGTFAAVSIQAVVYMAYVLGAMCLLILQNLERDAFILIIPYIGIVAFVIPRKISPHIYRIKFIRKSVKKFYNYFRNNLILSLVVSMTTITLYQFNEMIYGCHAVACVIVCLCNWLTKCDYYDYKQLHSSYKQYFRMKQPRPTMQPRPMKRSYIRPQNG